MKTGHVNIAAGALSLLCSVVWALLSGDLGAVICTVVSFCWIAVGFYQIATADDTEPRPAGRIARRFFRIVTDWI
jgi:hypothetical protein